MNLKTIWLQAYIGIKSNFKVFFLFCIFFMSGIALLFSISQMSSTLIIKTNKYALSTSAKYDGIMDLSKFSLNSQNQEVELSTTFLDYLIADLNANIEKYNNTNDEKLKLLTTNNYEDFLNELFKRSGNLLLFNNSNDFKDYLNLAIYYEDFFGNPLAKTINSFLLIENENLQMQFSASKSATLKKEDAIFEGFGAVYSTVLNNPTIDAQKDKNYISDDNFIPIYIKKKDLEKFNIKINDTFEFNSSVFGSLKLNVKVAGTASPGIFSFSGSSLNKVQYTIGLDDIFTYLFIKQEFPTEISYDLIINSDINIDTDYNYLVDLVNDSKLLESKYNSEEIIYDFYSIIYDVFESSLIIYWIVILILALLIFTLIVIMGSFVIRELLNKIENTIRVLSIIGANTIELAKIITLSCLIPILFAILFAIPLSSLFTKLISISLENEITWEIELFNFTWITWLVFVIMFAITMIYFFLNSMFLLKKKLKIQSFNKANKFSIYFKNILTTKTIAYKAMFGMNATKSISSFLVISISSTLTLFSIGFNKSIEQSANQLLIENQPYNSISFLNEPVFANDNKSLNLEYKTEKNLDAEIKINIIDNNLSVDFTKEKFNKYFATDELFISKNSTKQFSNSFCSTYKSSNNLLNQLVNQICNYTKQINYFYPEQIEQGFDISFNSFYEPPEIETEKFFSYANDLYYSDPNNNDYDEFKQINFYNSIDLNDYWNNYHNSYETVYLQKKFISMSLDTYNMFSNFYMMEEHSNTFLSANNVPVLPVVISKENDIFKINDIGWFNFSLSTDSNVNFPIFFKVVDYDLNIRSSVYLSSKEYLIEIIEEYIKNFKKLENPKVDWTAFDIELLKNFNNSFKIIDNVPYFLINLPVKLTKPDENNKFLEIANIGFEDYEKTYYEYTQKTNQYKNLVSSVNLIFISIEISLILTLITLIVLDNKNTVSIFKLLGYGKRKITLFALTSYIIFVLLSWPTSILLSMGLLEIAFLIMENQINFDFYIKINLSFIFTSLLIALSILVVTWILMHIFLSKVSPTDLNKD